MTPKRFKDFLSSQKTITFQNGIWYSATDHEISYPDHHSNDYFELEDNSFWFRHRCNCIIAVIKKYAPDRCFFDIGGGNGFLIPALANIGIPAVLIEPGRQAVKNAQKRNIENIFCGTTNELEGLAGQITSIGAFDVIEHIEKDNVFVKDVYKLLENGGYIFITVPSFQFLWSDEDLDVGHFRRYTRKSIVKILTENGFDILFSSYFFSILLIPLFFIRTLPSFLGFRKISKTQIQNEHQNRNGFTGRILDLVWKWELKRIQNNKIVPFGTSCLVVARKK